MTSFLRSGLATGLSALLLLSCQAVPAPSVTPAGTPRLTLNGIPRMLETPHGMDWTAQAITCKAIQTAREAHLRSLNVPAAERRLLAFPSASSGWSTGPGVALSTLGASGDTVPNGPASSFYGGTVSNSLFNKVFFLTRAGKFIKVDKTTGTLTATAAPGTNPVGLGGTFSRTYVTLSPSCSRAYVVDDSGNFSIINTLTMQKMSTVNLAGSGTSISVAGGRGIAPVVDPVTSTDNDAQDDVYIPGNDGKVTYVQIRPGTTATQAVVSATASYTLSTIATTGYRFQAPGLVLGGVIYIGDTAGNFYTYDTVTPANSTVYDVGDPVQTAPAIELQDGTTAITDASGNAVSVPAGSPIYVFTNSGRSVTWINLYDDTVNSSLDLYVDDNDAGQHYGYLLDYASSSTNIGRKLFAVDSVTMSTDGTNLPGIGAPKTTNFLGPSYNLLAGSAGSAVTYLRWQDTQAISSNPVVISKATVQIQCKNSATSPPLRIYDTSPYYAGSTSTLWTSANITNAAGATQRPALGTDDGKYASGGLKNGVVNFNQGNNYKWNAVGAWSGQQFGAGVTPTNLAVALVQPSTSKTIFWGGGTAPAAGSYWGTPFYPSTGTTGNQRPTLNLTYTAYSRYPTGMVIQTPPIIDSFHRKVYVLNCNQVFAVDYSNPDNFTEANYDWATKTGPKYTLFNETFSGIVGGSGGGMYSGKTKFIFNMCAPLMNFNGTALYALSMYYNTTTGGVATWDTTLNKFNLQLLGSGLAGSNVGTRVGNSTVITSVPTMAVPWDANSANLPNSTSCIMLLDPYVNESSTGGGVYFGLGNGRVYQYDN